MSLILLDDPGSTRHADARAQGKEWAAGSLDMAAWLIGGMLAISVLVSAVLMAHAGLTIDPWSRSNFPYYAATILVLILRMRSVRERLPHGSAISEAATHCLIFTVIALTGAITSYPVAAMSHGYADASLQRIDVMLHFDWQVWYRLVASHPILQWSGIIAYESIYVTPAILLGWFAARGDTSAAHRFLASFWLAAVVTLALFSLMPAVGPLAYLWREPISYMPRSELWQSDLIPVLRAHTPHVIDLAQLRGLVSAPSFHAAAAAIYITAAWRIPRLRWLLVPLNSAMLLSTPVEGTHYLADIIIGIGVAIAAMAVVGVVFQAGKTASRPGAGSSLLAGAARPASL